MGSVTDYLNSKVSKKPKERIGIGGFILFARVSENVSMTSRVPTIWLEDGSFAQDQIILDPVSITISGEVSDIHIEREAAIEAITKVQQQVGVIETYLPTRSDSQIQRINAIINDVTDKIREVDRAIDNGEQLIGFFGNNQSGKTNRELFIDDAETWHYGRTRIKIETPWRVYDDMVITSLNISRNNEFEALSFTLTAQKIRFAKTIYADINEYFKKPSPAIDGKTESVAGKGPQKPESIDESLLSTIHRQAGDILNALGYSF